jgi:hypothetical protein
MSNIGLTIAIDGFMEAQELDWLYEQAKTKKTIVEIGSFLGRSTFALCAGCPGTVYAVDHFKGSPEHQKDIEKGKLDLYAMFMRNVGYMPNLKVLKMSSWEASQSPEIPPKVDMVFVDGAHDFISFMIDLIAWVPRTRFVCGHDREQEGVPNGLRYYFGENGVKNAKGDGSLWYKEVLS